MSTSRSRLPGGRTGRRPGTSGTRESIIVAAREVFAERGYDGATVRGVASRAGVDPALLYHYFGSKQQLFVAAMEIPYDWETAFSALASGPRDELGERLVRLLLSLWESPEIQPLFVGLVRSAATDPVASEMLRKLLAEGPFLVLAKAIGTPDAELRAMLIASHVMGVALLRYILGVEPIASVPVETLASTVSPTVQRYLTEDLAGA
ncbi:MAG: TetR family transcriptional regulator [Chloroflexota bacterium]|nr:TetR family transcriptional regulator [Chloroflexota bacterium]